MCTVLLPPCVTTTVVNKYIIIYKVCSVVQLQKCAGSHNGALKLQNATNVNVYCTAATVCHHNSS